MVRREDGGPVPHQQRRVGRNGRPFRIYKFRTMRIGADQELAGLIGSNEHDGPVFEMRRPAHYLGRDSAGSCAG